ncbi:unnamed protein product [Heterobilharzia americana]|nr:unnamed protein product [Heterobilharzia americana]
MTNYFMKSLTILLFLKYSHLTNQSSFCTEPLVHFKRSGEIKSHSEFGINPYSANLNCEYEIHAPVNHKIIIEIVELDLEESNGCIFDYLLITDEYYTNMYIYCGRTKSPNPLEINHSIVYIKFSTDDANQGNGFLLKYEMKLKEDLKSNSFYHCGVAPQLMKYDSKSQIQSRIVGGQITTPGQWPWMATIREKNEFRCGASLIDSQWLLTAAHCFPKQVDLSDWKINIGDFYINWIDEEEISFNISSILIHPNYRLNRAYDYDFALVKTALPMQYSTKRTPICLFNSTMISKDQLSHCYVAGWGNSEDSPVSNALRHLNVQLLDLSECNQTEAYKGRLTERMTCAGYLTGGKDACKGDSGGPLMCQLNSTTDQLWYQVGVVSFGKSCAAPGTPGVYSNVTFAIDWIYSIIRTGE